MRKFLSQTFWSHGTSLGSLGLLSQGDVHTGFSRPQFLVIWGPYNYPGIVACHEQAENPNSVPSRCAMEDNQFSRVSGSQNWPSSFSPLFFLLDISIGNNHTVVVHKLHSACFSFMELKIPVTKECKVPLYSRKSLVDRPHMNKEKP